MKIVSRRIVLSVLAAAFVVALLFATRESHEARAPAEAAEASPLPARSTSIRAPEHISAEQNPVATRVARSGAESVSLARASDRPRFISAIAPAQKRAGESDVALQTAQRGLRDYQQAFHQNPIGNNAEITKRLLGHNARNMRYLPADAPINSKGQLIDRWDQPIFFHQISASVMDVRSAGPDHIMWTADDEVLR